MPFTPSIRISQHQRFHSPPPAYPPCDGAVLPMAIARAHEPVPPPLPPPTYLPEISAGQDPGWQWGNDPNGVDFGRAASVKPGSSLLGGAVRNTRPSKEHDNTIARYPFDDARRGSSISTITAGRDQDMPDDSHSQSDEDGNSSRPTSNYRYVALKRRRLVRCACSRAPLHELDVWSFFAKVTSQSRPTSGLHLLTSTRTQATRRETTRAKGT